MRAHRVEHAHLLAVLVQVAGRPHLGQRPLDGIVHAVPLAHGVVHAAEPAVPQHPVRDKVLLKRHPQGARLHGWYVAQRCRLWGGTRIAGSSRRGAAAGHRDGAFFFIPRVSALATGGQGPRSVSSALIHPNRAGARVAKQPHPAIVVVVRPADGVHVPVAIQAAAAGRRPTIDRPVHAGRQRHEQRPGGTTASIITLPHVVVACAAGEVIEPQAVKEGERRPRRRGRQPRAVLAEGEHHGLRSTFGCGWAHVPTACTRARNCGAAAANASEAAGAAAAGGAVGRRD
jgi:hypothetical protein